MSFFRVLKDVAVNGAKVRFVFYVAAHETGLEKVACTFHFAIVILGVACSEALHE